MSSHLLRDFEFAAVLRIPTKKIAHSDLKTIRTSPSDAGKVIVRQVIVMSQEKGWDTGNIISFL